MASDLELIEAAKRGSVDAFTELVHAYRERLLRFLVTRCASFADAEDALQDTLINAYRYLHSYDPQWRFSTWLYRIAIRNAARHNSGNVTELGDIADSEDDPLSHCIRDSERSNLWRAAKRVLNDESHNASEILADERGVFPAWEGSDWQAQGRRMRNACTTTVTGTIHAHR